MSRPTRMMFGKHRGKLLTELPHSYLGWLLKIELREPLRSAVEDEARRRALERRAPRPEPRFEPRRESAPEPTRRRVAETRPAPRPATDGLARAIEAESNPEAESAATADEWADVMAAAGKAVGRA